MQPNHYTVCFHSPYFEEYIHITSNRPETATPGAPMLLNSSSNHDGAPPANPRLLALHATCSRVAQLSGAAELFDKLDRDAEETSPRL